MPQRSQRQYECVTKKRYFVNMLRFLLAALLCLCALAPMAAQFAVEIHDTDGIPISTYHMRRLHVLESMPARGAAVILAADVRNRQNDVDYEFRQNSNFLYLTGFQYPDAALVLLRDGIELNGAVYREIMFVRERKREREQWTGVEMGPEEAMSMLGIDTALPYSSLPEKLKEWLPSIDTLFLPSLPTKSVRIPLVGKNLYVDVDLKKQLQALHTTLEFKMSMPILAALREVKDADELRLMQKAVDVSIAGHRATMRAARPGMTEYELEAVMEYEFKRGGAEDVGYPSIVGSKYNACILHYTSNRRRTAAQELVLADCGAEYHGYTADITRTFPMSGRFTQDQRTIYSVVLEAQDSGIAAARVGAPFRATHEASKNVIARRLMELGIIAELADVKKYFMHGTSHYLGLDVHDAGTGGALKTNSVITVEPGVYIPDGSSCDKRWWNIGVRIEDDIHITDEGPVNMSGSLPRRAEDIEALMTQEP